MRLVPRSLANRLLAISALTTIVALAFAAYAIGQVLERFVIRGLDQQLDAQVAMLARAVRPDGTLDAARIVDLPAFERAGAGWGWRVESRQGRWTGGDRIMVEPRPPRGGARRRGPDARAPVPGEAWTETGAAVHTRSLSVPAAAGEVLVLAGGPRRLAVAPLREAAVPLLSALAILGAVLALAAAMQRRYGLRPLRAMQAAVAAVRAGRARHVPLDQPSELALLAIELNALVDQNETQLAQARRHVANLAHGLKTPLAALDIELAAGGHDPGGRLRAMVADIDARVRHHLGRARAAAPGGGHHARTLLAAAIDDLVAAMRRIHADRAITVTSMVAPGLAAAADPQDIDEILGNLLDNAWRHARSTVTIAASPAAPAGRGIALVIEDDGPGLSEAAAREALVPGRRLDERVEGYGFGLPIARELIELYGGELILGEARTGGLRVAVILPAAA